VNSVDLFRARVAQLEAIRHERDLVMPVVIIHPTKEDRDVIESQEGQLDPDDPTQVDPDDPSQQSEERTRVEQERRLSDESEGPGPSDEQDADTAEEPSQSEGETTHQPVQGDDPQTRPVQDNPQG
jgi:hypothetical protein